MEWFSQKLDSFVAAVVIAVFAIVASQSQAFITQYVQRVGGHLDEARANLATVQTGLRYRLMSDTVRGELEAEARKRTNALQVEYDSVVQANVFAKPYMVVRHADRAILAGTWHDFVPALPVTSEGVTYVLVGMVVGFVLYELLKLPLIFVLREPRRRKFRRRG